MSEIVDLRSDTVTRPSPRMRQAMFEAEVGDDVFGEDPTVRRLEETAAEMLGKEAALLAPSGTMCNQIALKVHTSPGDEIVCDDRSHVMLYEMGMTAQFAGCVTRAARTADGLLGWSDIEPLMRGPSDHFRGVRLIEVENTHNMAGGRVYPLKRLREIAERARAAGVPLHMDGARIFNAAAALGCPVGEIAQWADTVSFCLSKGLGAPIGSLLVASKEFIREARLVRKGLGGGMRQAGVIAAAGLVALEETPADLPRSHADAHYLADEIAALDGVALDQPVVETNIVFFRLTKPGLSAADLRGRLREKGVLVTGGGERVRMLTHKDVDRSGCRRAVAALREALVESDVRVGSAEGAY